MKKWESGKTKEMHLLGQREKLSSCSFGGTKPKVRFAQPSILLLEPSIHPVCSEGILVHYVSNSFALNSSRYCFVWAVWCLKHLMNLFTTLYLRSWEFCLAKEEWTELEGWSSVQNTEPLFRQRLNCLSFLSSAAFNGKETHGEWETGKNQPWLKNALLQSWGCLGLISMKNIYIVFYIWPIFEAIVTSIFHFVISWAAIPQQTNELVCTS